MALLDAGGKQRRLQVVEACSFLIVNMGCYVGLYG
jgi:hypothetical protein